MRANVWVMFLQLAETMVRGVLGLLLGLLGCMAILSGCYQLLGTSFHFFSGMGVFVIVSLAVGGLLLWFASRLLNSLVRRGQSA
ncbi:MAG: hypothetical protein JO316_08870 [Abitibacteriaceae bacterium]|nr:hypothetical protein [Abditibacteriaceae bacterium]MBV9865448.1 hypothetical protein [Abditibacteriaceae bacterium]